MSTAAHRSALGIALLGAAVVACGEGSTGVAPSPSSDLRALCAARPVRVTLQFSVDSVAGAPTMPGSAGTGQLSLTPLTTEAAGSCALTRGHATWSALPPGTLPTDSTRIHAATGTQYYLAVVYGSEGTATTPSRRLVFMLPWDGSEGMWEYDEYLGHTQQRYLRGRVYR